MLHRICRRSLIFSLSFFAASSLILVTAHGEPQRSNPQRAIDSGASGQRAIDRNGFRDGWWKEPAVTHGMEAGLFVGGLLHHAMGHAALSAADSNGDGAFDHLTVSIPSSDGTDPTIPDGVSMILSHAPSTTEGGVVVSGWEGAIGYTGGGGGGRIAITGFTNPAYIKLGIGDIDGQCNDRDHKEWIDVSSVSTGILPPSTVRVRATKPDGETITGETQLLPGGSVGIGCGAGIGPLGPNSGADVKVDWNVVEDEDRIPRLIITNELCFREPTPFELENWINPGFDLEILDKLEIEVEYEIEPATFPPTEPRRIEFEGESGFGDIVIEITYNGLPVRSSEPIPMKPQWYYNLEATGSGHIAGIEKCGNDPKGFKVCQHAIEISNLGDSGDDGFEMKRKARTGRNPQTGKEIKIAAKALGTGDTLVCGMTEHLATDGGGGGSGGSIYLGSTLRSMGDAHFASADFSEISSSASVCARDPDGKLWCWGTSSKPSVIISPGGSPIEVSSVIESPHAGGEHVPGMIWRFTSPVMVPVPDQDAVLSSELRFVSGQPKIIENDRGLLIKYVTAPGAPKDSLIITDIADVEVGFTTGHVFGLLHVASDGAEMSITDLSTIDNAPEEKERGLTFKCPDGACASIHAKSPDSSEASGMDFLVLELLPLDLPEPGDGITGEVHVSPVACENCDLSYGWTHRRTMEPDSDLPYETLADFSGLEVETQTISLYLDGKLVAQAVDVPNNTPVKSQVPVSITHQGRLYGANGEPDSNAGVEFRFNGPVLTSVGGGLSVVADRISKTGNVYEEVAVKPIRLEMGITSGGGGGGSGGFDGFTIVDEAVGVFDLEHRASGAARIGCCPDVDGDGFPDLVLNNPSSGSPATLASNNLRLAQVASIQYAEDRRFFPTKLNVPDPCLGKPEPCGLELDEAVLVSGLSPHGGGTTSHDEWNDPTVRISQTGSSSAAVDMPFTPENEPPMPFTLGIMAGDKMVAEILMDHVHVDVLCDSCSSHEIWPGETAWDIAWKTEDSCDGSVALRWDSDRLFMCDGCGDGLVGDGLRVESPKSSSFWCGMSDHLLTTVNIPELHILEMSIEDIPVPDCPGDINGDGVVNGFDLVELLSCWGPATPECVMADLNGDELVNGFDLVDLLSAWGPCQ